VKDLLRIEADTRADRLAMVGITCGFSAAYAGKQLQHAMSHPSKYAAVVALGFNPPSELERTVISGWDTTFFDIIQTMTSEPQVAAQQRFVLAPCVGPEAVAGSTRLKVGGRLALPSTRSRLPPPPCARAGRAAPRPRCNWRPSC
jgi:hypothetical protein